MSGNLKKFLIEIAMMATSDTMKMTQKVLSMIMSALRL